MAPKASVKGVTPRKAADSQASKLYSEVYKNEKRMMQGLAAKGADIPSANDVFGGRLRKVEKAIASDKRPLDDLAAKIAKDTKDKNDTKDKKDKDAKRKARRAQGKKLELSIIVVAVLLALIVGAALMLAFLLCWPAGSAAAGAECDDMFAS